MINGGGNTGVSYWYHEPAMLPTGNSEADATKSSSAIELPQKATPQDVASLKKQVIEEYSRFTEDDAQYLKGDSICCCSDQNTWGKADGCLVLLERFINTNEEDFLRSVIQLKKYIAQIEREGDIHPNSDKSQENLDNIKSLHRRYILIFFLSSNDWGMFIHELKFRNKEERVLFFSSILEFASNNKQSKVNKNYRLLRHCNLMCHSKGNSSYLAKQALGLIEPQSAKDYCPEHVIRSLSEVDTQCLAEYFKTATTNFSEFQKVITTLVELLKHPESEERSSASQFLLSSKNYFINCLAVMIYIFPQFGKPEVAMAENVLCELRVRGRHEQGHIYVYQYWEDSLVKLKQLKIPPASLKLYVEGYCFSGINKMYMEALIQFEFKECDRFYAALFDKCGTDIERWNVESLGLVFLAVFMFNFVNMSPNLRQFFRNSSITPEQFDDLKLKSLEQLNPQTWMVAYLQYSLFKSPDKEGFHLFIFQSEATFHDKMQSLIERLKFCPHPFIQVLRYVLGYIGKSVGDEENVNESIALYPLDSFILLAITKASTKSHSSSSISSELLANLHRREHVTSLAALERVLFYKPKSSQSLEQIQWELGLPDYCIKNPMILVRILNHMCEAPPVQLSDEYFSFCFQLLAVLKGVWGNATVHIEKLEFIDAELGMKVFKMYIGFLSENELSEESCRAFSLLAKSNQKWKVDFNDATPFVKKKEANQETQLMCIQTHNSFPVLAYYNYFLLMKLNKSAVASQSPFYLAIWFNQAIDFFQYNYASFSLDQQQAFIRTLRDTIEAMAVLSNSLFDKMHYQIVSRLETIDTAKAKRSLEMLKREHSIRSWNKRECSVRILSQNKPRFPADLSPLNYEHKLEPKVRNGECEPSKLVELVYAGLEKNELDVYFVVSECLQVMAQSTGEHYQKYRACVMKLVKPFYEAKNKIQNIQDFNEIMYLKLLFEISFLHSKSPTVDEKEPSLIKLEQELVEFSCSERLAIVPYEECCGESRIKYAQFAHFVTARRPISESLVANKIAETFVSYMQYIRVTGMSFQACTLNKKKTSQVETALFELAHNAKVIGLSSVRKILKLLENEPYSTSAKQKRAQVSKVILYLWSENSIPTSQISMLIDELNVIEPFTKRVLKVILSESPEQIIAEYRAIHLEFKRSEQLHSNSESLYLSNMTLLNVLAGQLIRLGLLKEAELIYANIYSQHALILLEIIRGASFINAVKSHNSIPEFDLVFLSTTNFGQPLLCTVAQHLLIDTHVTELDKIRFYRYLCSGDVCPRASEKELLRLVFEFRGIGCPANPKKWEEAVLYAERSPFAMTSFQLYKLMESCQLGCESEKTACLKQFAEKHFNPKFDLIHVVFNLNLSQYIYFVEKLKVLKEEFCGAESTEFSLRIRQLEEVLEQRKLAEMPQIVVVSEGEDDNVSSIYHGASEVEEQDIRLESPVPIPPQELSRAHRSEPELEVELKLNKTAVKAKPKPKKNGKKSKTKPASKQVQRQRQMKIATKQAFLQNAAEQSARQLTEEQVGKLQQDILNLLTPKIVSKPNPQKSAEKTLKIPDEQTFEPINKAEVISKAQELVLHGISHLFVMPPEKRFKLSILLPLTETNREIHLALVSGFKAEQWQMFYAECTNLVCSNSSESVQNGEEIVEEIEPKAQQYEYLWSLLPSSFTFKESDETIKPLFDYIVTANTVSKPLARILSLPENVQVLEILLIKTACLEVSAHRQLYIDYLSTKLGIVAAVFHSKGDDELLKQFLSSNLSVFSIPQVRFYIFSDTLLTVQEKLNYFLKLKKNLKIELLNDDACKQKILELVFEEISESSSQARVNTYRQKAVQCITGTEKFNLKTLLSIYTSVLQYNNIPNQRNPFEKLDIVKDKLVELARHELELHAKVLVVMSVDESEDVTHNQKKEDIELSTTPPEPLRTTLSQDKTSFELSRQMLYAIAVLDKWSPKNLKKPFPNSVPLPDTQRTINRVRGHS
ncbi:hypothetical protein D5018_00820 [Parashewanella curva]|uniref:Uncharacterized protein n=1 Tax=Parashewanella curva TaxID=2338552 RepID=A0A3L8Q3W6_9GAMM|nr:hypothetical protein [Parashewanella curva]RLV61692.1 hypothetical protein D5018_00820 [Parashewanella curva]